MGQPTVPRSWRLVAFGDGGVAGAGGQRRYGGSTTTPTERERSMKTVVAVAILAVALAAPTPSQPWPMIPFGAPQHHVD
jgi:hypothetical protein